MPFNVAFPSKIDVAALVVAVGAVNAVMVKELLVKGLPPVKAAAPAVTLKLAMSLSKSVPLKARASMTSESLLKVTPLIVVPVGALFSVKSDFWGSATKVSLVNASVSSALLRLDSVNEDIADKAKDLLSVITDTEYVGRAKGPELC